MESKAVDAHAGAAGTLHCVADRRLPYYRAHLRRYRGAYLIKVRKEENCYEIF